MRTSTESAVSIQGLVKKYGERAVVDGVSLEIEKGAIFGLLGPNGAGKSSIINIISGISRQTSGEVFVLGKT
jgi:ABC-2 type transport system ATP-binding protein